MHNKFLGKKLKSISDDYYYDDMCYYVAFWEDNTSSSITKCTHIEEEFVSAIGYDLLEKHLKVAKHYFDNPVYLF